MMRGSDRAQRWLRRLNAERPRPYEHLTDAELLDALERDRRGEDTSDVPPYPGDPSTWPATGFEHLSDDALRRLLDEEATAVRGRA